MPEPSGQETVSVSAVQVLHFARSPPESKPAAIQRARFSGVMSFGGSPASQASGEPSASRSSWLGCAALGTCIETAEAQQIHYSELRRQASSNASGSVSSYWLRSSPW